MKSITSFIILFVSQTALASASTSNQMTQFSYSSCSEEACVVLKAPKAYVGIDLENFVTSGATTLQLTDTHGNITASYLGDSVSYNPKLKLLVLEFKTDGFLIYSLKDGKLSDFRSKVGSK